MNESEVQVLVTGGTGFLGVHTILQLLQKGYKVKTTVRSLNKKNEVLKMLKHGGIARSDNLLFIEADLVEDKNWDKAVEGCKYVLHLASPVSLKVHKDENELIVPAVEGTKRILNAAKSAGVKRVVLTSSSSAIEQTINDPDITITEDCWTDLKDKKLSTYVKAKTMAEQSAWKFIKNEGQGMELTVINPGGMFGPELGTDLSSAPEILKNILNGEMKAFPKISFGIVDVRDVADLHIRAMTMPQANGQRFLAITENEIFFKDIALILKNRLGERAKKISSKEIPNWVIRFSAIFSKDAATIVNQLGILRNVSNDKAKRTLAWRPRSKEEAILATAESLFYFNHIKI
jgi:dihydroflavonol-4-reductase